MTESSRTRDRGRGLYAIAMGLAVVAMVLSFHARAEALGDACEPDGSCSAADPACDETTWGVDNCGSSCYRHGPACCTPTPDSCSAVMPTKCGQTAGGQDSCGYGCSVSSAACPTSWQPYGFAMPGDAQYGFGLPDNAAKDLIGLAAKGNVILGDYTSAVFAINVLPSLQTQETNPAGKTQPYVVDPTDAPLGYDDDYIDGQSVFNGDYTRVDEHGAGVKTDWQPRRFYESSLPDIQLQALIDPLWNPTQPRAYRNYVTAVLYTNHALAGYMPGYGSSIFGSVVSRDEALAFGGDYASIIHDLRLTGSGQAATVALPLSIKRPRLVNLKELSP